MIGHCGSLATIARRAPPRSSGSLGVPCDRLATLTAPRSRRRRRLASPAALAAALCLLPSCSSSSPRARRSGPPDSYQKPTGRLGPRGYANFGFINKHTPKTGFINKYTPRSGKFCYIPCLNGRPGGMRVIEQIATENLAGWVEKTKKGTVKKPAAKKAVAKKRR